jgi:hypothetical protein
MAEPAPTLARRLGAPEHRSVLLHRAAALGLTDGTALAALAALRGVRYYAAPARELSPAPEVSAFSNAELAIALLHPAVPWEPHRIRLGAAVLAADDVEPRKLAHLAVQERCEAVVRHIAEAGAACEPDHPFWRHLLAALGPGGPIPAGVLPHPTRFVAATGFAPSGQRGWSATWIRPQPTPAAA